jgi:23S rRNA-/tRNA-specific pseudouridylate synthase
MITINYKSFQIPVLASEKGWLAVDKPAGMTVHNDTGNDLCSIAGNYIVNIRVGYLANFSVRI